MKLQRILVILIALCLTGCSFGGVIQETTIPPDQIVPVASTQQTEPTVSATQTTPTDPMQADTTPPQGIVQPEPADEDFVKVKSYIPDIIIDLRYSTDNNFTGQTIYGFNDVWLRYGTVKKLMLVQEELKQSGLYLKIWDGFRPPSAQFKLWDICPDPTYVSDPNNGFSSHSRGNTVDITLAFADGTELVMPTGFDDFTKLADRDYSDCSQEAAANAVFLEQVMQRYGFRPYSGEWWHYTDTQSYPVDEIFEPIAVSLCCADCNEYISLRTKPSTTAQVITKILVGEQFKVVAKCGDFVRIEYKNLNGYVLSGYIRPVE